MKILIIGSRSVKKFDLFPYVGANVDMIISGGANGIDTIAEEYADKHKISKLIIRPRYDLYGRAAPIKRNEEMVDLADEIIVIWDGTSKGTKYSIDYAEKKGKKVNLIMFKEGSEI
jgi:hypothetical protein